MIERIVGSRFFQRVFEILIPLLTWFIITLPIWLSPFHPAVVAYFIICFDLYFFYKSIITTFQAAISYKKILLHENIPYQNRLKKLSSSKEIVHFVLIPNFKEPLHKLEATINSLIKNNYPYKNIVLVLGFEEREKEAKEKLEILNKKYCRFFKDILASFHPLLEHEVAEKPAIKPLPLN